MTTYSEAIRHARSGKTISRGDKTIRVLTQEEADAYALQHNPSRRVVHDEDGKPLVKKNKIVVEEYGQGNPRRLGLFDVSGATPIEFRPTAEDIASDWTRQGVDDVAEPIAPEAVDEVLHEAPIE